MAEILILEDDDFLRSAMAGVLEEEGYQVRPARSGPEALAIAGAHRLDLAVVDVRMEGMDGLECLARLRELQPGVRSIVITGYASEDAPTRAIRLEAEDYLYKPFELDDFLTAVERVLVSQEERGRYDGLLATLVGSYHRLLETAGTAIASAQLASLERDRERCFRAIYVGIRSSSLDLRPAMHIFSRLEELENQRQQLMTAGLHFKLRREVLDGYRYLTDLTSGLSREHLGVELRSDSGSFDAAQFHGLYAGVQKGRVSLEQLRQAPFLRSLDRLVLRQSKDLMALYQQVWGELTAAE